MFEIYQSEKSQEFYFRMKAKNGEAILKSEGYKTKASAENGIESVRKNAPDNSKFQVKEAKDGRQYFILKAANGQVIGQSQYYKSESGCKNGMASVTTNCDGACTDLTV